jgi:hypothetical protein
LSLETTSNRGDVATVCLTPAEPETLDPRHPVGVPPTDVASLPHSAVWSPPGPWPVYVGTVFWKDQSISTTEDNRVCAGLRGEAVLAPSGRARIQVGAESSNDTTRFAIATEQVKVTGKQAAQGQTPHILLTPRLGVDAAGDVSVRGTTTLGADLVIHPSQQAHADTPAGMTFAPIDEPTVASPWTFYRTQVDRNGRSVDQLRIEIAHPGEGGDPTRNRFVVGTYDQYGFRPCLTVNADRTVIAHHDVTVDGSLRRSPSGVDRNDPRYASAAIDGFVQGFLGAAHGITHRIVGDLNAVALAVTVSKETDAGPTEGKPFGYTVTVTNFGSAAATNGQIHIVISINKLVKGHAIVVPDVPNLTLEPGIPFQEDLSFPVDATADSVLRIEALALAVGPAANVVSATAKFSATVR